MTSWRHDANSMDNQYFNKTSMLNPIKYYNVTNMQMKRKFHESVYVNSGYGCQVVIVLSSYSDNLSSNPAKVYTFFAVPTSISLKNENCSNRNRDLELF